MIAKALLDIIKQLKITWSKVRWVRWMVHYSEFKGFQKDYTSRYVWGLALPWWNFRLLHSDSGLYPLMSLIKGFRVSSIYESRLMVLPFSNRDICTAPLCLKKIVCMYFRSKRLCLITVLGLWPFFAQLSQLQMLVNYCLYGTTS